MGTLLLFALPALLVGVFLGLMLGAALARTDLRVMAADLEALRAARPSDAAASESDARTPSHIEGR